MDQFGQAAGVLIHRWALPGTAGSLLAGMQALDFLLALWPCRGLPAWVCLLACCLLAVFKV